MALIKRKPKPAIDHAAIASGLQTFANDLAGHNGPALADLAAGLYDDGITARDNDIATWPTNPIRNEHLN